MAVVEAGGAHHDALGRRRVALAPAILERWPSRRAGPETLCRSEQSPMVWRFDEAVQAAPVDASGRVVPVTVGVVAVLPLYMY